MVNINFEDWLHPTSITGVIFFAIISYILSVIFTAIITPLIGPYTDLEENVKQRIIARRKKRNS